MKNILVITPFFYPHIGGSERYMEDLYVSLKRENPSIEVDILCYNTNNAIKYEKYKELNILRVSCFNILPDQFSLPNPIDLIKLLVKNRNKYDLIHVSTRFFDSSWWAPIYAKTTKTKIILTDHCVGVPKAKNEIINLIIKILEKTIVKFSIGMYSRIYSQNLGNKTYMQNQFGVRSILAYPGVDLNLKSFKKKNLNEKINVIYAGRLIASKGIVELLDIALRNSSINFKFAGEGPLLSYLREKSRGCSNINVLGRLNKNELITHLLAADIFVYPTKHNDGIPMAIIEAGNLGLCVLTMNTGGISEVIKHMKNGILVKQNDFLKFEEELLRLTKDKKLRYILGKNLMTSVRRKFNWSRAVNLIIDELE